MKVIQNLVSPTKYSIKCPYTMKAEFFIVHNTANDASAINEVKYMIRNNAQVSYHYAIDDKNIVQGIPDNRNAWNAGDGGRGRGNRKGLSFEICYSKSGGQKFIAAEKLAAKFLAFKLKEKGWGINKVTKHQDYSGKYCPHRTLDMGWQRFLNMIQVELNALNTPQPQQPIQETIKVSFNGTIRNVPGKFVNGTNSILIQGKYFSIREVAESMGFVVGWDQANKVVLLK